MTLAEALEKVELEPGKTYRCSVRGMSVQLRVTEAHNNRLPLSSADLSEDDVMLDAWDELPRPQAAGSAVPTPGVLPLPDVPMIPDDESNQE